MNIQIGKSFGKFLYFKVAHSNVIVQKRQLNFVFVYTFVDTYCILIFLFLLKFQSSFEFIINLFHVNMIKTVVRNLIMAERAFTLASRSDVEAKLTELSIPFTTAEHPPVATIAEMLPHVEHMSGTTMKNLFVKDKKKGGVYLITAMHDTQFSYADIAKKAGTNKSNIREADESILYDCLGSKRGAVNFFALANDTDNKVTFYLDSKVLETEKILAHPMENTATTELASTDLINFLKHYGREPVVVNFGEEVKEEAKKPAPKKGGGGKKQNQKQKQREEKKQEDEDKNILGLTVGKSENFPRWYTEVITKAEMIEYYDISGCYILRPWSYSIWETIQEKFDRDIKSIGVQNCYFPMFVSNASLQAEADHIEGFAPEVAWVTKSGQSELAEPIAIRPTSETIMYPTFKKWIRSHRDLPLRLNQWCNVVRWEFKQPTPFLRTREFLWQEGHSAHATLESAEEEVMQILEYYAQVYTDLMAIPVVKGKKSEKEKFAGGYYTTTVETINPDNGRGIQGGTSHCLGQNFSKMFKIKFLDEAQKKSLVWQNSWGLSTRTIGVLVMFHGDDKGLVLPPRVAPIQVVIVPIHFKKDDANAIDDQAHAIKKQLVSLGVRVNVDDRDNYNPGWKYNHWELKGVPLRVELGPKDMQNRKVKLAIRYNGQSEFMDWDNLDQIPAKLEEIQDDMYKRAQGVLADRTKEANNWEDFMTHLNNKNIILSPWCNTTECEEAVKDKSAEDSKALTSDEEEALTGSAKTLCMPFEQEPLQPGMKCFFCEKMAVTRALWGRSY